MLALIQRLKFDQEIYIAGFGIEVRADRATEYLQTPDTVTTTDSGDLLTMLGYRCVHKRMVASHAIKVKTC